MSDNKYFNFTNLCLFGVCYGVIRSEFYHKKTLKKNYNYILSSNNYIENHTITTRVENALINALYCQFLTLPYIMFQDINLLEKKIRKMNITDDDIPFPFVGYVWKK